MKKIVMVSCIFILAGTTFAQRVYFNLGGGMINYGGDLQEKLFTFNQANKAYSIGVTYKLNNQIAITGSYVFGKLAASDAKSHQETYRRNLSFYTNITEGSLTFEASLLDITGPIKFTPYILGGGAVFHYNPYAFDVSNNKVYLQPLGTEGQGLEQYPDRKIYRLTQFSIPFGLGIKYAITNSLIIGAEANFRKTFTDYLDDVSMDSYVDTTLLLSQRGPVSAKFSFRGDELADPVNFSVKAKRGNPDRKDVYYTGLIKLSFSFGSMNFSGNSYSRKLRKQTGCPVKVF